jgi:hypothetical protein
MTDAALTTADFPLWTTVGAWVLLGIAVACAVVVTVDVVVRPQKMAVMAAVWPLVMLFGSILWLWFYGRFARAPRRDRDQRNAPASHEFGHRHGFATAVAIDTNHCGAGCALGDLVAEALLMVLPGTAALVGLGSLYDTHPIAGWIVGTVLAFVFGIAFQYFAIAPMRHPGLRRGLLLAVKADAASIAAWQVGMIGTMAVIQLVWLPSWLGGFASPATPQFWVLMQIAMVVGYAVSYPVNWWLVRSGVKSPM